MCGILALFGYSKACFENDANCNTLAKSNPKQQLSSSEITAYVRNLSLRMKHRGPEESGSFEHAQTILCHERLAIVGVESGHQPIFNATKTIAAIVNGEIYNYRELAELVNQGESDNPVVFTTKSDSEIIVHLYEKIGVSFIPLLEGVFSFALYDVEKNVFLAARDPYGVTSFYIGLGANTLKNSTSLGDDKASLLTSIGGLWVASELRALKDNCERVIQFPPGHYITGSVDSVAGMRAGDLALMARPYYAPDWMKIRPNSGDSATAMLQHGNSQTISAAALPQLDGKYKAYWQQRQVKAPPAHECLGGHSCDTIAEHEIKDTLHGLLVEAVVRRIPEEVPYGVLLSGGLDSSLVASIVAQHCGAVAGGAPVRTYSIGMAGAKSPDLQYAHELAQQLGTTHTSVEYTLAEGIAAVPAVVEALETYDVTTVRASTPMYLLARQIARDGVKVVLSGEGSDEIFGGYLYFHMADSERGLQEELVRLVRQLHKFDCLRANKSAMAWGVEARVPFLDARFVDYAMRIPASLKRCGRQHHHQHHQNHQQAAQEKYLLRSAFDRAVAGANGRPLLPATVLWRQKEQFSDGVGYGWIDGLRAHAESSVSDTDWARRSQRFPQDTPKTREAYHYRAIFEQRLGGSEACLESVENWVPKAEWGCPADPSGRAQAAHESADA